MVSACYSLTGFQFIILSIASVKHFYFVPDYASYNNIFISHIIIHYIFNFDIILLNFPK